MTNHETRKQDVQESPARGDALSASPAAVSVGTSLEQAPGSSCSGPSALRGWSPAPLPADTRLKRLVDRILPSSGLPALLFFATVVALLNIGLILPTRADLAAIGVATLAAGSWCGLTFWRCRHAHCAVTGAGWLALAVFTFVETGLGHSVIGGDEGLLFLAVLGAGLVFEGAWYLVRRTNAVTPHRSVSIEGQPGSARRRTRRSRIFGARLESKRSSASPESATRSSAPR